MAKIRTLQLYRGTTAQNDAFTGAQGELTMDTTLNELRVHDGITAGGHKIGGGYHPDLFTWQWADHELNDVQWLRADTFSWQSGAVYQAAYQHLVDDIDGKTLQSETVGSTTIQFYLADDGHKICPAGQENNVTAIYNATGVAWYYILDTVNERFKLPRSKHNKYASSLGVIGNGKTLGLTDGTKHFGTFGFGNNSIAMPGYSENASGKSLGSTASTMSYQSSQPIIGVETDPTKSGMIAQQEQDTDQYKYLYFYVGNFTQTALENTAGLNASLFNDKADLDFGNTTMIDYVVEKQDPNSSNNYTWYRKYKSGWVEQGGFATSSQAGKACTFPIVMADTNYAVQITVVASPSNYSTGLAGSKRTTTAIYISNYTETRDCCWEVKGIAAS